MLTREMIKKIESFVCTKPRSVDEIAKHIGKNWRTADRYISEIEKEFGTISTRVFREGSRGAIKIVFWSSIDNIKSTEFQQLLEEDILHGRRKEDFSGFDVFQFVQEKNKSASVEQARDENDTDLMQFSDTLKQTKKQLLIFSGNLSFVNLQNKDVKIFSMLEDLVKRDVSIKIICRVDLAGIYNIEKILSLNFKYGKESIEIRHRDQPLRANIIDNRTIRIKEVKEPTGKINELNKRMFIFYNIKDKEWTEWLSKVFWKMFSSSIDARVRIDQLKKLI